ncbi:hypothetical protein AMTR_s00118p00071600 [Amborella trichopoda]|uniref:Protein FAR1-RELATED SEQUENCE n=1 Tax=Amborella trichopoda TaxID=13333 RepID=W1NSN5_AMBTC|nr:hypothetical protein AMTR_s00118p00071600 [Amborella trichopoda]
MYVTAGTGLQKFMNAIEKLQNKKFTKEKEKDSKDLTSTHVLKTAFLIEEHAAKTYTQKVFRKFQEEVVRSSNCLRKIIEGNDEFAKYKVEDIGEPALENDDLFEKLKLGFSKLAEEVNATRESLSNAHAPPTSTRCNAVEDDACGSIRSVDVSPLIHMPE